MWSSSRGSSPYRPPPGTDSEALDPADQLGRERLHQGVEIFAHISHQLKDPIIHDFITEEKILDELAAQI